MSLTAKLGIQTEHLFPRSFGAASHPALGDLHHLVPTKASINTLRRNAPFADIPDDQTKYWIHKDKVLTTIPRTQIHQYSESKSNAFEPIEFQKETLPGLYFTFTLSTNLKLIKRAKPFSLLCSPISAVGIDRTKQNSTEIKRSMTIARIQSNVNPFVFDPSLVERCYCNTFPALLEKTYTVNIYPNPLKGLFYIDI
ncbi:MAG: endonuclease [Saprospiraceae bacterium]|nr:endonuclease [Saprospiraceae bacterium]